MSAKIRWPHNGCVFFSSTSRTNKNNFLWMPKKTPSFDISIKSKSRDSSKSVKFQQLIHHSKAIKKSFEKINNKWQKLDYKFSRFIRSRNNNFLFQKKNIENIFGSLSVCFDFVLTFFLVDDVDSTLRTIKWKKYTTNSFNLFSMLLHEDIMWKYVSLCFCCWRFFADWWWFHQCKNDSNSINKCSALFCHHISSFVRTSTWNSIENAFDFFLISFALLRIEKWIKNWKFHNCSPPQETSESIKTLNGCILKFYFYVQSTDRWLALSVLS